MLGDSKLLPGLIRRAKTHVELRVENILDTLTQTVIQSATQASESFVSDPSISNFKEGSEPKANEEEFGGG